RTDSRLMGVSQPYGAGTPERTRQTMLCLLLLYLLIPGAAALALLASNPVFVHVWLPQGNYAGNYVSGLIVLNLLIESLAGGTFKGVAVLGYRLPMGWASLASG